MLIPDFAALNPGYTWSAAAGLAAQDHGLNRNDE